MLDFPFSIGNASSTRPGGERLLGISVNDHFWAMRSVPEAVMILFFSQR